MFDEIFNNKVWYLFKNAVALVIASVHTLLIISGILETLIYEWF